MMRSVLRRGIILIIVLLVTGVGYTQKRGDELVQIFARDVKSAEALVPADIQVEKDFKPGLDKEVGVVEYSEGEVFVIHLGTMTAYTVKPNIPLFEGDTLVTGENARVQARFEDRSTIALAPYSKIVLDKVFWDQKKQQRDSVTNLVVGRARFVAQKVEGARPDDYKVLTPTATVGIRGSDFAVAVSPQAAVPVKLSLFEPVGAAHAAPPVLATVVLTGPSTVVGFSGSLGAAQTVGPFSASFATAGAPAAGALSVTPTVATQMLTIVGPKLAVMAMPPEFD